MRVMKVRFTEWRDAPVLRDSKVQAVSEIEAAQAQLAALDARTVEVNADIAHAQSLLKIADSAELREDLAGHAAQADNVFNSRKAAMAALAAAGEAAAAAMKTHPRTGSFGYQIIDDAAGTVVKLVDDSGADLPAGAVYGYQVIDAAPPAPAWLADVVKGLA